MATENKPAEETSKGDENPLPVAEPVPAQLSIAPIAPSVPTASQDILPTPPAQPAPPSNADPIQESPAGDNSPNWFERRTVLLGWLGLGIAFLSFLAALTAGGFIYHQWLEMNAQTGFMNRAAIQARRDSADSSAATSKQLTILQGQLTQQTDALRMDQRPWLKFEMEGERPPGIDPNNVKTHIVRAIAGQPMKTKIKVTNVGKTTAENLLGTLIIQIVPKDHQPSFPIKRSIRFFEGTKCAPTAKKEFPGAGWREGVLYPNEVSENEFSRMRCSEHGTIEDDPLTQTEQIAINGGQSYILTFGEVWYSDVFGVRHWTRFCQMANAELNVKVAERCAAFQGVDDYKAPKKPN